MDINTNFNSVKLGETVCYHIGLLAGDREGELVTAKGSARRTTQQSIQLDRVAREILNRSTTKQPEAGSGEFELKQKRLAPYAYAYLAKRIR